MKHKISISIDEEVLLRLKDVKRSNRIFRSKSHIIEYAIDKFLTKVENDTKE